jgi:SPX domain protein involved in polyphosphate accumulation
VNSDYRYEIKFVLNSVKLSDAMQWLYTSTTANKEYENRIVNSIYFDDIGFSSIRDNLAGVAQRNKFRLRWYGNQQSGLGFEVKIKSGRLSRKEIYPVNLTKDNLMELSVGDIASSCLKDLAMKNVIFDDYMIPTLKVSYEREYYETHNGIRITIDQHINFSDLYLHTMFAEEKPIHYPFNVMEVKFDPSMKKEVSKLIKPLHTTPTRHSKYLVGMAIINNAVYI